MAKFNPPFAHDGERRSTTSDEQEYGIPCGPFDRPMWHGLFHNVQAELGNLISASGQVDSSADLEQVAKAIQSLQLNYAIAGGTANAATISLHPAPATYPKNLTVVFSATNTGAMTIKVNSLTAVAITYGDGSAILAGEIYGPRVGHLVFDGAKYILINPILYFTRLSPKAARRTYGFTPIVALADLPVDLPVSALRITIAGASYIDVFGACAFKNESSDAFAGSTTFLQLTDATTGMTTRDATYLGLESRLTYQIPVSLRSIFQNLDPTRTYYVDLMCAKRLPVGPVRIFDPTLNALHD